MRNPNKEYPELEEQVRNRIDKLRLASADIEGATTFVADMIYLVLSEHKREHYGMDISDEQIVEEALDRLEIAFAPGYIPTSPALIAMGGTRPARTKEKKGDSLKYAHIRSA